MDDQITDEQREFDGAVYRAINEGGKFPEGHPHAGLTRAEAMAKINEDAQNPPPVKTTAELPKPFTPNFAAKKKDAGVE